MSEKVRIDISEWSDEKLIKELEFELDVKEHLDYVLSFIDEVLNKNFDISLDEFIKNGDANAQHIIALDEELKTRSNYYPNNLN